MSLSQLQKVISAWMKPSQQLWVIFAFMLSCLRHHFNFQSQTLQLEPSQCLLTFLCSLSHLTRGSVGLLSWTTAGVFVLCWSILLSPICCGSLAWKQDQERFHTYTHWPLINKSDQGPFPHIATVPMETKTIQTRSNHRDIPEQILIEPNRTSGLSGSDLASQILIRQSNLLGRLSGFFFYFIFFNTWSDDFSLVAPPQNTRRLVPISCSPFFSLGLNRRELLCKFVI